MPKKLKCRLVMVYFVYKIKRFVLNDNRFLRFEPNIIKMLQYHNMYL